MPVTLVLFGCLHYARTTLASFIIVPFSAPGPLDWRAFSSLAFPHHQHLTGPDPSSALPPPFSFFSRRSSCSSQHQTPPPHTSRLPSTNLDNRHWDLVHGIIWGGRVIDSLEPVFEPRDWKGQALIKRGLDRYSKAFGSRISSRAPGSTQNTNSPIALFDFTRQATFYMPWNVVPDSLDPQSSIGPSDPSSTTHSRLSKPSIIV